MTCLFLTILIILSYYYLISSLSENNIADKLLASFLMTCSQIVATELVLGLTGLLYLYALIIVNVSMSVAVVWYSYRKSGTGLLHIMKADFARVKDTLNKAMDLYNGLLLLLVILSYSWVIVAAYFLPLRGVDDLFYHLPPIFEYIQTHTIRLLPIAIHTSFAFPQNAELLFLWPALFSHSQKMLDCVNVPFVLVSIVVVYSLLRHFVISKKDALFAAFLYALCPVVIMQAGTNYIDLIVSLFLLLSLYYTILYLQRQRALYACLAAMAIGLVCGMKYTAFFLTIPFQMIILWQMAARKHTHLAGYFALVVTLSGWWYLRNAAVLGNPFYPMNVLHPGMGLVGGSGQASSANFMRNVSNWMLQFPLEDIGVGSYDGGFGLVFWGLGFSSWLCVSVYSLMRVKETGLAKFIVLMQLPIGFFMLLFAPNKDIQYDGRLSIFVVAIGLFALSLVFTLLQATIYQSAIKTICILFSALTVCLMGTSIMPSYRIDKTIFANKSNTLPSEYRFPMNSNPIYPVLARIWYPLDYLSRDDRPGVNCYIAANKEYLALAPFYGSNLQNRPITIDSVVPEQTEAFAYLYYPDKDLFGHMIRQEIFYPRRVVTKEEVLSRPEFAVITQTEYGCLIMSRAYLRNPVKIVRLRNYYGGTWPEAVTAAEKVLPHLQPGIPLVTADSVAYGLLYLELGKGSMDGTLLVPAGYEEHVARTRHLQRCYTLEKPLPGYVFDKIATVNLNRKAVAVYLNHAQ